MMDRTALLQLLDIEGPVRRLDEAMTHPSFVNEHPGQSDYQRLEFLGDAVLGLCVTELLLSHAPTAKEGQLTRMRALLVNTQALADFAHSIHLAQWVNLGKGASLSGDALQPKVLADVVEALVGAVYLEHGLDGARKLTRRIVDEPMTRRGKIAQRDPKSELQERVQRGGGATPVYHVLSVSGSDHDLRFDVEVRVEDIVLGRGQGRSKKSAEQAAARMALINHRSNEKTS